MPPGEQVRALPCYALLPDPCLGWACCEEEGLDGGSPYLPAVSCSHFSNNAFRACAPEVRGSVCDLTSSLRRSPWRGAGVTAGSCGDGGDWGGVTNGGLRREAPHQEDRPGVTSSLSPGPAPAECE